MIFKEKGFDYPKEPKLDMKLKDDSPSGISTGLLNDEEIAVDIRERIRAIISMETEAARNAIHLEARTLILDIFMKDNKFYSEIFKLQKEKSGPTFHRH